MGEDQYGLTVPESVSNHDLKKVAWEFARNKGNLVKLPKILGLSDERWKEFLEWLKDRSTPRQPDPRYPILIPETSPTSYFSFKRALNLRLPDEWTGDWHFRVSFFGYPERSFAPLAGPNGLVDTTRSLGSRGVRDMGRLIDDYGIKPYDGPVWVAKHSNRWYTEASRPVSSAVSERAVAGGVVSTLRPCSLSPIQRGQRRIAAVCVPHDSGQPLPARFVPRRVVALRGPDAAMA